MNAGRPQPRPEDIERVIELGEGNGYAQPWENTRKGPSLLAELAEKTGKDIDTLTPGERIAFHIGWVRGRIRKYEEAGAIDPAEIAHARENEQFYREKLRQILETPPTPPLSPAPTPIPATPLPESHEIPPEAPSFSRYLHKILENPTSPEAINLLNKLKSDSGRLWIDKKKPNGTVTRIWLSLDLTPEEKAKLPAEFIDVVKAKLTPGNLRFRVDEGATSWRTEWEGKKNAIQSFVSKLSAAPKERKRCEELAASLSLGIPDGQRKAFVDLLMTYLERNEHEKPGDAPPRREAEYQVDTGESEWRFLPPHISSRTSLDPRGAPPHQPPSDTPSPSLSATSSRSSDGRGSG
ncbi:hypothetical protein HYW11_02975 [Candidatus Peregrinibacteria bacterium]|nr:hypothetical protein [Candidatus Peregrinibacteria bacterium]